MIYQEAATNFSQISGKIVANRKIVITRSVSGLAGYFILTASVGCLTGYPKRSEKKSRNLAFRVIV